MNFWGKLVSVLKLRGGSNGRAGETLPYPVESRHTSRPLEPSQMFQYVHLESAGAFGTLDVSASKKYHRLTGFPSTAPASRMKNMNSKAPAMRMSETKLKIPPE